jgi:YD repeat-containing protein
LKGDLTSDGRRALEYDDENQLTRITVTNSWRSDDQSDARVLPRGREWEYHGVVE